MKWIHRASCIQSTLACLILSAFIWKQTNLSKCVPEVHNTLSKAHNVHVVYRNLQKRDYFHFNWKSETHISSDWHLINVIYFISYFTCFFKLASRWWKPDNCCRSPLPIISKQLDGLLEKGPTEGSDSEGCWIRACPKDECGENVTGCRECSKDWETQVLKKPWIHHEWTAAGLRASET